MENSYKIVPNYVCKQLQFSWVGSDGRVAIFFGISLKFINFVII